MYGLSPLRFGSLSATTSSPGINDPKVGDLAISGNEEYRYIYNGSNSQLSQGFGCVLTGVSGYTVTASSTTSTDLLVGIVKHATIATNYYGYICTRGFTGVVLSANLSCAAGALLILAADGKFSVKDISTGNVSPGLVKAMTTVDTSTGAAAGTVYVSVG